MTLAQKLGRLFAFQTTLQFRRFYFKIYSFRYSRQVVVSWKAKLIYIRRVKKQTIYNHIECRNTYLIRFKDTNTYPIVKTFDSAKVVFWCTYSLWLVCEVAQIWGWLFLIIWNMIVGILESVQTSIFLVACAD